MKKQQAVKLVLIEWWDAFAPDRQGWNITSSLQEQCAPMTCLSVGWLLAAKNGYHMISSSVNGIDSGFYNNGATGTMAIPNGCIKRMTVLKTKVRICLKD